MFRLFFGNLFSVLTLVLVLALFVLIALSWKNRQRIRAWGRLLLLFILMGTAVSAFCAIRDGYATQAALFAVSSPQSAVCSIAGGAIFLTGLIAVMLKKQTYRKVCFYTASALFVLQVLVIEASRLSMLL